ncbi:MAG: hypothetical protein J7L44_02125 [Candidatus Diapherotrites archaeon]|nr:hypothetical protein [Candidatus Diapherotrites archaeon]
MRPREFSEAEVADILQSFSRQGLLLSGSLALNFFFPEEFRRKRHDDIDLIFPCRHFTERELLMLNKLARTHGFSSFEELVEHTSQQPRRKVFQALNKAERLVMHVEVTDLRVPSKEARFAGQRVTVRIPDINYLFARLLYAASSPTRLWHRRLDDIAYLCNLMHFCKTSISRKKVLAYFRKLCGGDAKAKQRRANFAEVLKLVSAREVAARVAKTRTKASFDYERALQALASFGRKGKADLRVAISRRLYYLPASEKEALYRAHGLRTTAELFKKLQELSSNLSDAELSRALSKKPRGFVKKFLRRR